MDFLFGIDSGRDDKSLLQRGDSVNEANTHDYRRQSVYSLLSGSTPTPTPTTSFGSNGRHPPSSGSDDSDHEAETPEYDKCYIGENCILSEQSPGPGMPFAFGSVEPPHSNVPRTIVVGKSTWDFFSRASLGRSASGTFTNFFQARDEFNYGSYKADSTTPRHRSIFGLPMMSPYSSRYHLWTGLINTVDATYTAFFIPFIAAFISRFRDKEVIFYTTVIDLAVGLVFLLDILINFHTGFVLYHDYKKKVVMHGKHVAWYYLKYGGAWIDLLVSVCVLQFVSAVAFGFGDQSLTISVLRLFRLVRVYRILKRIYRVSLTGSSIQLWYGLSLCAPVVYLWSVVYSMLVMMNFLGCLLFYAADIQKGNLEGTWIYAYTDGTSGGGQNDTSKDILAAIDNQGQMELYITSLYWAVTTVTTVGYGDIVPSSLTEKIVLMGVMLSHIMLFGLLIGSISELVKTSLKSLQFQQGHKQKIESIGKWMKYRDLPSSTIQDINSYYTEKIRHTNDFDEEKILDELPLSLRIEVIYRVTKHLLRGLSVFSDIGKYTLKRLTARLVPIQLPPGRELIRQGDDPDSMFILEEGQMMVLFNELPVYTIRGPVACGETGVLASFFPRQLKRPATLRTVTLCTLWKLSSKDLVQMFGLDAKLQDSLTEGYRLSLLQRFDCSRRSNELEKKIEAEFGCKLDRLRAVLFKNHLETAKVGDGTFLNLLEDLFSGTFSKHCSTNRFRSNNALIVNSLERVVEQRPSVDEENIRLLLNEIRKQGELGMVQFVSRLKQSAGENDRIDLDGLRKIPEIAALKTRFLLKIFVAMDVEDMDSVYIYSLIDQLRALEEFSDERESQIIELFKQLVGNETENAETELLQLADLSRSFRAENHPMVISGALSTSSAVHQFMTNIGHEDVGLNAFVDFHKDLSLCTTNDANFLSLTDALWVPALNRIPIRKHANGNIPPTTYN